MKIKYCFVFALMLGFNTHDALCMQENEDQLDRKALTIQLSELKQKRDEEREKNAALTVRHAPELFYDMKEVGMGKGIGTYPLIPGTHDALIKSNQDLVTLSEQIQRVETLLSSSKTTDAP